MIKDTRANRYSLKIIDINGEETIIPINYNEKTYEKMPLSIIDKMTTKYSEEELLRMLMDMGYNYGYIFIDYRTQGKRKTLPVAYSDKELIADESNFREKQIQLGNGEPKISENTIKVFYQLVAIERHNKKLWSYLQHKNYIWTDLTLAVATYNHMQDIEANQNDILEYQYDILEKIGSYSNFRKIIMGINKFKEKEFIETHPNEYQSDIYKETIKKKIK